MVDSLPVHAEPTTHHRPASEGEKQSGREGAREAAREGERTGESEAHIRERREGKRERRKGNYLCCCALHYVCAHTSVSPYIMTSLLLTTQICHWYKGQGEVSYTSGHCVQVFFRKEEGDEEGKCVYFTGIPLVFTGISLPLQGTKMRNGGCKGE